MTEVVGVEIDWAKLFPLDGVYVGLDPSRTSSGLVIVQNGEVESYCLYPEKKRTGVMAGVEDKEELKNDLEIALKNLNINLMVVEKVFFGGYVNSFIHLVEIMNVVEELIHEGKINVKRLIRVQNTTWKSWLRPFRDDGFKELNGNQGKDMVNHCLSRLGFLRLIGEGKGWQDRVDALGMLVGFRLMETGESKVPVSKIEVKNMQVSVINKDDWEINWKPHAENSDNIEIQFANIQRFTAKSMLKLLETDGGKTSWISKKPVILGFEKLHIPNLILKDGVESVGYLVIQSLNKSGNNKTYDEWVSTNTVKG